MTLGQKLYLLRNKHTMTQEQLAEKLQVSRQSISKWESDATRPDLGKLKFLAEFYHLSLDQLLDETIDIFSDDTSRSLNKQPGSDSTTENMTEEKISTDSTDSKEHSNTTSDGTDPCAASGISQEMLAQITSEIAKENHIIWKRTAMGFGAACLALTIALIAVTVKFSTRIDNLSNQIARNAAPVYVDNSSDYTSEQDTYFQSYTVTADSVSEDGSVLHVKFSAILKNYQDNTSLTMQLQNNSDQNIIPVTFSCENGTYIGYADLPVSVDTYTVTACIDTDGLKQTVSMDSADTLSVLSLTDWQPSLEITGNTYDKMNRRNDGSFGLSCVKMDCRSFISDVTLQVLANDTPLYSYSLNDDNLNTLLPENNGYENILDETADTIYINYSFRVPKNNTADSYTVRLHWYNSFLKQYITYEVDGTQYFNTTNSNDVTGILFESDLSDDYTDQPINVTFSAKP